MKKKIKDISLDEAFKICNNYQCMFCPFNQGLRCLANTDSEKEIEIDEKQNKRMVV